MLYGAILRAPVEGAAPDKVDDAKAKSIAGVLQVVRLPYGIGVIAQTSWAAFDGKEALGVTWTHTGKAWGFDSRKALPEFAKAARDMSLPTKLWAKQGDAPAALQTVATIVEADYHNDLVYHAQMEPLNAVASVSPNGDACELWCGVQSKTIAVTVAASALKIAPDKINYHDMLMGGGFGRRGHRDEEYVHDAVVLSNAVKKPVKVMWTREDDVHNGRFNQLSAHFLRAGFDASGQLVAFHHRKACDEVTAFQDPVRFERQKGRDGIAYNGLDAPYYEIANRLGEAVPRETGLRTSSLRGIAHLTNIFAIESFMDELALKRGADPAAFRRELVKSNPRAVHIIDTVSRMADWEKKRDDSALGFTYMNYSGTQIALAAEVALDRKTGALQVRNVWTALDPGIAVQPDNVVAQTESSIVYGLGFALFERITIEDGAVEESGFYDYRVPRMSDIPQMHIEVIPTHNHPTGVGQMATPLMAPAIANAVARLTGVRLRETPMTAVLWPDDPTVESFHQFAQRPRLGTAARAGAPRGDRGAGARRAGELFHRARHRVVAGAGRLADRAAGGGAAQHRDREAVRPRHARAQQRHQGGEGPRLRRGAGGADARLHDLGGGAMGAIFLKARPVSAAPCAGGPSGGKSCASRSSARRRSISDGSMQHGPPPFSARLSRRPRRLRTRRRPHPGPCGMREQRPFQHPSADRGLYPRDCRQRRQQARPVHGLPGARDRLRRLRADRPCPR